MIETSMIFNRRLHRIRRDRAAANFAQYDFLKREAAERLADRLEDMARPFPLALDLGCHGGQLQQVLRGRGGIHRLIQTDASAAMLRHATGEKLVCDEEFLPFADNSFDLVMSVWSLHHVNDLPGTLIQIRRILKPDGLFLAILPGAHSLHELRGVLADTEMMMSGGISPRIAPFIEVRDGGNLLQRAGFALPVVDSDMLHITYPDALALMRDVRGMGETNLLIEQSRRTPPRMLFAQAAARYAQDHTEPATGHIRATVELVTLTAWKPHPSQQQPAKRGSGQVNLAQLFGEN